MQDTNADGSDLIRGLSVFCALFPAYTEFYDLITDFQNRKDIKGNDVITYMIRLFGGQALRIPSFEEIIIYKYMLEHVDDPELILVLKVAKPKRRMDCFTRFIRAKLMIQNIHISEKTLTDLLDRIMTTILKRPACMSVLDKKRGEKLWEKLTKNPQAVSGNLTNKNLSQTTKKKPGVRCHEYSKTRLRNL